MFATPHSKSVIFAVFASALALAAPAHAAETLTETLVTAYQTNPRLLAARAELRAVDEGVPAALSGWRPSAIVTGEGGVAWSDSHPGADENHDPLRAGLELTQPLYRGGLTTAETAEAENLVLAQRALLADAEQAVLLDAVTAYMDVLRDEATLELNKNNEQVLSEDLEAARIQFDVGVATLTDVSQAESRLAGATADRIAAEGQLRASRADFAAIVGNAPGSLTPAEQPGNLPADEAATRAAATLDSPRVIAAEFTLRAAEDGIDVAFSQLLPSLALVGRAETSDEPFLDNNDQDSASLMLELTVPLYQAGAPEAEIRRSKQIVSQRRQELENNRRLADAEAVDAWQAFETAQAQIESFTAQVESARIALEGVRAENEVGARTVLDILDAEQEFLDAQVSLVAAKRDAVVASYRVLAAIGRLTARDLALPVDYYDAEAYYNEVRDQFIGTGADPQ